MDVQFGDTQNAHRGWPTGAGKSSLSLALLRMIPTTGNVYCDGVNTSTLNLDVPRSNITSIPQQPKLVSGTLRQNLDPFDEQQDDAILNVCLRLSGLFSIQRDDDEDEVGLDTNVLSGGANFSLGQRPIIALARAMVGRSKVNILDKATASVDSKTDSAIQEAIATEFNDMSQIIVARRLQTIMNAGKVLPRALLLDKKKGTFKTLVDGSGDREALYGLVMGSS